MNKHYYMRNKTLIMAVFLIVGILSISTVYFIDRNSFYFLICITVSLLVAACFINIVRSRKFAEKRRKESQEEIEKLERYVKSEFERIDNKLTPLTKQHDYLRFLDDANLDINHEYKKVLGKYQKLLNKKSQKS